VGHPRVVAHQPPPLVADVRRQSCGAHKKRIAEAQAEAQEKFSSQIGMSALEILKTDGYAYEATNYPVPEHLRPVLASRAIGANGPDFASMEQVAVLTPLGYAIHYEEGRDTRVAELRNDCPGCTVEVTGLVERIHAPTSKFPFPGFPGDD
jgi:hypothetical protein